MTEEELRQHLYELSYALDSYSVDENYDALRKTHYDNIEWMKDHGLLDEYYKSFLDYLRGSK